MLAEAFEKGQMTRKELILANLFNSLPRFFLHLPTVFFLTAPLIKLGAVIYVGITFTAALLQTFLVVLAGRLLLPGQSTAADHLPENETPATKTRRRLGWREAVDKSVKRLKKRIVKILKFMIPVYILFFFFTDMVYSLF